MTAHIYSFDGATLNVEKWPGPEQLAGLGLQADGGLRVVTKLSGRVHERDGQVWSPVTPAVTSCYQINDLWTSPEGDVVIDCWESTLHIDPSGEWTEQRLETNFSVGLNGEGTLAGVAADDLFGVVNYINALWHYDGLQWTAVPQASIDEGEVYTGIAPRGPGSVYLLTNTKLRAYTDGQWSVVANAAANESYINLKHSNEQGTFILRATGDVYDIAKVQDDALVSVATVDSVLGESRLLGLGGDDQFYVLSEDGSISKVTCD